MMGSKTLGTLYCHNLETGKTFELHNVQDMTLTTTVDMKPADNQIQRINREPKSISFSIENAQWNLNNLTVRQLLGLPISNNWLQMHGYPMRRRKRK